MASKRNALFQAHGTVKYQPLEESEKRKSLRLHCMSNVGLSDSFVKALNKEGEDFKYISTRFPQSVKSQKSKVVLSPDQMFTSCSNHMNLKGGKTDIKGTKQLGEVDENILGNKNGNYRQSIGKLIKTYETFGRRMSLKIAFSSILT